MVKRSLSAFLFLCLFTFFGFAGNPISVLDYGCVGDGVTNDSPCFQNAINAAGVTNAVYVPPGTYHLHSTLVLTPSNGTGQKIFGIAGASWLDVDTNIPMLKIDGTVNGYSGEIHDLGFQCRTTTRSSVAGILIDAGGGTTGWTNLWRFRNLAFRGCQYGIRVNKHGSGVGDTKFDWNLFENIQVANYPTVGDTVYGIYFDYGSGTGNVFNGYNGFTNTVGMYFGVNGDDVGDLIISNGHFGGDGSSSVGIKFGASASYKERISIVSCDFDAGVTSAIEGDGYGHLKIVGCNFGGASPTAITKPNLAVFEDSGASEWKFGIYKNGLGAGASTPTFRVKMGDIWQDAYLEVVVTGGVQGRGDAITTATYHINCDIAGNVFVTQLSNNSHGGGIFTITTSTGSYQATFNVANNGTLNGSDFHCLVRMVSPRAYIEKL